MESLANVEQPDRAESLLERSFPWQLVSELARRDRTVSDPVYSVHKWWARRPPSLIRAILVAAALSADETEADFWAAFSSDAQLLAGKRIGDPFMGGATTLVEAMRLGAGVVGSDVDPLAVLIARAELGSAPSASTVRESADEILHALRSQWQRLYPRVGGREPLHYFWLTQIECPQCEHSSVAYREPVIARDVGHLGGVRRPVAVVAFCSVGADGVE
jgi:putative DNA methylase